MYYCWMYPILLTIPHFMEKASQEMLQAASSSSSSQPRPSQSTYQVLHSQPSSSSSSQPRPIQPKQHSTRPQLRLRQRAQQQPLPATMNERTERILRLHQYLQRQQLSVQTRSAARVIYQTRSPTRTQLTTTQNLLHTPHQTEPEDESMEDVEEEEGPSTTAQFMIP